MEGAGAEKSQVAGDVDDLGGLAGAVAGEDDGVVELGGFGGELEGGMGEVRVVAHEEGGEVGRGGASVGPRRGRRDEERERRAGSVEEQAAGVGDAVGVAIACVAALVVAEEMTGKQDMAGGQQVAAGGQKGRALARRVVGRNAAFLGRHQLARGADVEDRAFESSGELAVGVAPLGGELGAEKLALATGMESRDASRSRARTATDARAMRRCRDVLAAATSRACRRWACSIISSISASASAPS